MLDDNDDWPVGCPRCGQRNLRQIAWLKANARLSCDGCGATLWYRQDTFLKELDQAQRAIKDFSRSVRLKKQEL
jgi:transposase-like protein